MKRAFLLLACASFGLTACVTPDYNAEALKIGALPPAGSNPSSIETRRYDGVSNTALLAGATASMQDLGFTVSDTSSEAGIVTGTKTRSAVEAGQVASAVVKGIVQSLFICRYCNNPTFDKSQDIRATIVANPVGYGRSADLRVSFNRSIFDNNGQLSRVETIDDPKIYAGFFTQLDTALRAAPRS